MSIGESAFENTGLKSIDLCNDIAIGDSIFKDCVYLENAQISGLTLISKQMFKNSGLTEIKIPNTVQSIGESAFSGCHNLKKIDIENGNIKKSISKKAFFGNISLESIDIPDCVTSIENSAFTGCSALKNVKIGNGVTTIGDAAFQRNIRLTTVKTSGSVKIIGNRAFEFCSELRDIEMNGVESIGQYAFFDSGLRNIKLPNGIEKIKKLTFGGCKKLESIELNNDLNEICAAAFFASGLKSVKIPGKVKSINKCAFGMCKKLKEVEIEHGTESIGESVFDGCTSLRSISIPDSIKYISNNAFLNCKLMKIKTKEQGKKEREYKIQFDKETGKIITRDENLIKFLEERGFTNIEDIQKIKEERKQ